MNSTNNGLLLGTAVARRYTPFNTFDNQLNAREVDTDIRNARANSGVKDIRGAFNSQNLVGKGWASHHNLNIFEKRYTSRNATYWPDATWTTYTTKEGQNIWTASEAEVFTAQTATLMRLMPMAHRIHTTCCQTVQGYWF